MIAKAEVEFQIEAGLRVRLKGQYREARDHFELAVRLDPTSAEAHRYLGQTLSYEAAYEMQPSSDKDAALEKAERMIRRAESLQGGQSPDTLHDLAWIEDERGHYDSAIRLYVCAREQAEREGREKNVAFDYNLACAFSKAHKEEEALAELEPIIGQLWEWAEKDPDLAALRTSELTRQRFEQLIDDAKSGRGQGSR